MSYILDTQVFLWFITGDKKLSTVARSIIEDVRNVNFLSKVSIWEIFIKIDIGKPPLIAPFTPSFIEEQLYMYNLNLRDITLDDMARVVSLPRDHKDPYDRLIAAQVLEDGATLLSADRDFDTFPGVQRVF